MYAAIYTPDIATLEEAIFSTHSFAYRKPNRSAQQVTLLPANLDAHQTTIEPSIYSTYTLPDFASQYATLYSTLYATFFPTIF